MAKLTIEENQDVLNELKRGIAELQLLHDQVSDLVTSTGLVRFEKGLVVIETYNEKLEHFRLGAAELFDGYQLVDTKDRALDEDEELGEEGGDDEDEDGD